MKELTPFSYQGSKIKELARIKSIIGNNKAIVEPFFGSGIITGNLGSINKCIASELDPKIFHIWKYTKENNEIFFSLIKKYCDENNRTEEYYYDKRLTYNKTFWNKDETSPEGIALFYYLISSAHAALVRYGPNGFNTSFKLYLVNGRKYNIDRKIYSLKKYAEKLKSIQNISALKLLKNKLDCDIIYCDPPYFNSMIDYDSGWNIEKYNEMLELLRWQNKPALVSNYKYENCENDFDRIIHFSSIRQVTTKTQKKEDILGLINIEKENTLGDLYYD